MKVDELFNSVIEALADSLYMEKGVLLSIISFIVIVPITIALIKFIFNFIASLSSEHSKESASIFSEDYSETSEESILTVSSESDSESYQLQSNSNELLRYSNECEVVDMEEREYTTKLPKYNRK